MLRAPVALVFCCAIAATAQAQAPKSIDPGMSQAQVVERLGDPTLSRSSGDFTYLFYKNGCVRSCGMDDVVILRKDSVVDAMFRSPDRAYTGKSSSPKAIPAEVAARTRPGVRDTVSPEAVQAGKPSSDSTSHAQATTQLKPDSTAAKQTVHKRTPHHKLTPKAVPAAAPPDSATRDSIMRGSLRIKVMPKNFSPPPTESARADSGAKRPPHLE